MELTNSTNSSSSLKSNSSSSSLNLSKLEDESIMNSRSPVDPDHHRTPKRKHCQQDESRFFLVGESDDQKEHHFLESCFLCQKPICCYREIFMYRGDEAFCSEKCRTEQMEMDESLETVERRQRLRAKSSVSYNMGNSVSNSSEEQQQKKSIFSIQKQPTITNLAACGLISMQNSANGTNTTFMEP